MGTLNGRCGPAAQLHAAVACRLDERLTAVAKMTTSRSALATLLPALTANGLRGPPAQSAAAVAQSPELATTLVLARLSSSLPLATSNHAHTTASGPTGALAPSLAVSELNPELDIVSEAQSAAASAATMMSQLSTRLHVITVTAATTSGPTGLAAATRTAEMSDFDSAVAALALITSRKKRPVALSESRSKLAT